MTHVPGFLCRGFQTPSRSDWTGPAGCSSETEAAWSPAGKQKNNMTQILVYHRDKRSVGCFSSNAES